MPTPTIVTVLDKLTYSGNVANLAPVWGDSRLRFVLGDICDPAVVDDTVAGRDVVVHFAAESPYSASKAGSDLLAPVLSPHPWHGHRGDPLL
jgi:dTDP-glucose 4,6-dehydratase